jgi:D-alanyl-D-alanine dipeptidase
MKIFLYSLLFIASATTSKAQPKTISTKKQYNKEVANNKKNSLIDIAKLIPNAVLELRYASTNNFTNTNLYKNATTTYLRQDAAMALQKAANTLATKNLYIKIYDAYRPYTATKLMWKLIKDERYVANPKKGSNHNRGLAVDLTLVDVTGKELDMGTDFDNFTDSAHHSFINLSTEMLRNRKVLQSAMEDAGFKPLNTEWWHYSYVTTDTYSILDLKFTLLRRIQK